MAPICPFHFAVKYLALLRLLFGCTFQSVERRLPLFPSATGAVLSKVAVRAALHHCIAATGEPLQRKDSTGVPRDRFGEHVLRVAGAQCLARAGFELFLIQLFARWGSAAILRYVQPAPLLLAAPCAWIASPYVHLELPIGALSDAMEYSLEAPAVLV